MAIRRLHRWVLFTALVLGWSLSAVHAHDHESQLRRPVAANSFHRAGHPEAVHRWAQPTERPDFWGHYVGGGAPCHGDPGFYGDGTWGWDYVGTVLPKRVLLGWYHGRRYQGGTGAYRTDGPHLHH
jgi:hypothetical protein